MLDHTDRHGADAQDDAPECADAPERTLHLDPAPTIADFVDVARQGLRVVLTPALQARVRRSRRLVERFLAENRLIYGVTTGFGDNVGRVIAPEQAAELQRNIVRSHAVSVGEPLDREAVRAIMLMMVVNLGRGYSGVRPELMRQIVDMLNGDVVPYAPGEGSVGYLSVEAHVALVIMGEGRARVGAGAWLDGGAALRAAGLAPLSLACKEGLALLNGPGASNALAVLAVHDAVQAMDAADIAAALSLEMLRGTTRALDARYHAVKAHPEQRAAAAFVDGLLADSGIAAAARDQRLQDVLSLRAFPQTHGAARAFADHARMVIEREMASSGDNPIIWPTEDGDGSAMSGGNFDGSYVALACDSLAAALTMLGKSVERRIDRLVNAHFSGLPAFLSRAPGLNSGYMILQYTAAGLLGEMRSLAMPASMEGGSTCGNQEEPVSSAFNAAAKALRVAKKFEWLVAIELLAGCQAMEFHDVAMASTATRAVHALIRRDVEAADTDHHFHPDIVATWEKLRSGQVRRAATRDANGGRLSAWDAGPAADANGAGADGGES